MATAWFNRFEIEMTDEQAHSASHQGRCDEDVEALEKEISAEIDKIAPEAIRDELAEYGAWDAEDLSSETENRLRIVWLAACNIAEGNE